MMNRLGSPFKTNGVKISPQSSSPTSVIDECYDNIGNKHRASKSSFNQSPRTLTFPFPYDNSTSGSSTEYVLAKAITSIEIADSAAEAARHLQQVNSLLVLVENTAVNRETARHMLNYYQFLSSVDALRKREFEWFEELLPLLSSILYFCKEKDHFTKLPEIIIQEIFHWLAFDEYVTICCVNKHWKDLSSSNVVWVEFYNRKFIRTLPDVEQEPLSQPSPGATVPIIPLPFSSCSSLHRNNCLNMFKERLLDPEIGDKVEVAWKGKFRLESIDIYQGLAWWVAEVVDKHSSQSKYKIRYPGWESRWDEWVSRHRFRWLVSRNDLEAIEERDQVELWCCGANVPGAWLESRVLKVQHNMYCLDRVSSTGPMWVGRDRIRLSSKRKDSSRGRRTIDSYFNDEEPPGEEASNLCAIM